MNVMKPVNGYYLFRLGYEIHALHRINEDETLATWFSQIWFARASLDGLLNNSIFGLQTCRESGLQLLKVLDGQIESANDGHSLDSKLENNAALIRNSLTVFENVLNAELASMAMYLVLPKGGYDTSVLINFGHELFPPELFSKALAAVDDVLKGTRCIAFRLFTASGFHLHRANEAVLHKYWDAVTSNPRPKERNIGVYIRELERLAKSNDRIDSRVLASLRDLKDLHRNPLIHPDQSIEELHEAIALLNAIHGTITWMLKEIPEQSKGQ